MSRRPEAHLRLLPSLLLLLSQACHPCPLAVPPAAASCSLSDKDKVDVQACLTAAIQPFVGHIMER